MPITHQQAREGFLRFMFGGKSINWDSLTPVLQADIDGFLERWPPGTKAEKFFKEGHGPGSQAQPLSIGPDELSDDRLLVQELKTRGII